MGLSFSELNMLTMGDWLDFVDMWVYNEDDYERPATAEEIRNFHI